MVGATTTIEVLGVDSDRTRPLARLGGSSRAHSPGSCVLRIWVVASIAAISAAWNVSVADSGLSRATSPLSAEEEQSPALLAIARKFNPAMALPIRDVWPVDVSYAWHDGGDLVAQIEGSGAEPVTVVKAADLGRVDWSRLPHRTPDGRALRYYIDAPGDDRISADDGRSLWRKRFAAIAQAGGEDASPADSAYPPTQYVHAFWWNRQQGLLAIQYWFYYPFNEWVNHHEGDWEHIQIILKGPSQLDANAAFAPVEHHFFFHEFWTATKDVQRVAGRQAGDDHPVVYVGGRGSFLGYGGELSGGSYPQPARYRGSAFSARWLSPDEDTSRPVRYLAAADFKLIVLPEPERLDAQGSPALSWLRLPFYVGQRTVYRNPPGFGAVSGRPPLQPAARADWLAPPHQPRWMGTPEFGTATARLQGLPGSWTCATATNPRTCAAL